MKKDLLTVKELAAELRISVKSIQRAYTVESEKRANGETSETGEGLFGLSGSPTGLTKRTKQTKETK